MHSNEKINAINLFEGAFALWLSLYFGFEFPICVFLRKAIAVRELKLVFLGAFSADAPLFVFAK